MRLFSIRTNLGIVLWLLCRSSFSLAADAETLATMNQIFGALSEVLPLSLSEDDFRDQDNHEVIIRNLKLLDQQSENLKKHVKSLGQDYDFAGQHLARDAKDILLTYQKHKFSEARYLLRHITENCATCHAKMPEGKYFDASSLFKNAKLELLDPIERAALLAATRQFDSAVSAYETILADPKTPPAEMVLHNVLQEYVTLVIRVKRDPKRCLAGVNTLLKRGDVPDFLRQDLLSWRSSLESLKVMPPAKLNNAVEKTRTAQKKMSYPMDRSGYVDYVVASALLHQIVNERPKPAPGILGRAYYFLGITESLIGRSYWLTETPYYLETSIRLAPKASYAKDAYAMLEEQALLQYSGSMGIDIPEDVRANLAELRDLVRIK